MRSGATALVVKGLLGLVVAGAIAAGVAIAMRRGNASSADLPNLGQVPSFAMPDQRGHVTTAESLRGKVLVVDFFYATCTTSCPMMTGRMLALQKAVSRREQELKRSIPIHLVSITLDPENDTPEVLRVYAEGVGADENRWSFLSGRSQDLDRVVVRGFRTSFERPEPSLGIGTIMHGEWLVLVDATGAIRGYYAASDPERMQAILNDANHLAGGPP
jgi:protein SCO1/2